MARVYTYTLACGCLVSPDGAGGCIPCHYGIEEDGVLEHRTCNDAWAKFRASEEYKTYKMELELNANNAS